MARRKDPASDVVSFFQEVDLSVAQTVLAIVKGIVARRTPAKSKPRVVKAADHVEKAAS